MDDPASRSGPPPLATNQAGESPEVTLPGGDSVDPDPGRTAPRPSGESAPTSDGHGDATCVLPAHPVPAEAPSLIVRSPKPSASHAGSPTGPVPVHIEGYEIESELGRGGMGVVYKARQPKLRRTVAIKMIRAAGLASPEHIARFYAEARAVASLQHANIVQIYDVGECDTLPYFSLEFVPGSSLDRKLAKQPQPPRDAAEMIETLARAMHYAHEHGIVHRDLKPANVLMAPDGVLKITDFGLAKELGDDSGMSRDGQAMGTPSYMPPEQARGDVKNLGPLADVYSLGAILYEMLVGRPPFLGSTPYDTLLQVLKVDPIAPSQLVPRLPKDIETVCLKCLEKEPSKRYASALDLAEDCRRYLAGEPILSRPISSAERAWRWCQRNPRVASLLATVAGLLVMVAVGSTISAMIIRDERDAKEAQRRDAVDARRVAEENERIAEENERIAADQAELALGTLQTFVDKVQTQLDEAPRTRKLKKELLDTAIEGLDRVSGIAEKTTSIGATLLMAYVQYADMAAKSGETDEAMRLYAKCLALAEQQAADKSDHDASQANLATVATLFGEMTLELERDPAAALAAYRQALAIAERLASKPRSVEGVVTEDQVAQLLDESRTKIAALLLQQGDPENAMPLFREVLATRRAAVDAAPDDDDARLLMARSAHAVGEAAYLLGDAAESHRLYDECVAVQESLLAANPNNVPLEIDLAILHGDYGEIRLRSREHDAARAHFDRSVELAKMLVAQDAENGAAMHTLALALYRRGSLAIREGDEDRAARCFAECLPLRETLASLAAVNVSRQMELMLVLAHCGEHRRAAEIAASLPTAHGDRELLLARGRAFATCSSKADGEESRSYAEAAIESVSAAIAAGFRDATLLRTDPDLDPIRGDPGFPTLP